MKKLTTTIGIILIIFGIASLAYHGFEYTTREKIAQIGTMQVTQETQKEVYFPPIMGGLAIAAGIVLVIVARKK